jgi:hypothetical protein
LTRPREIAPVVVLDSGSAPAARPGMTARRSHITELRVQADKLQAMIATLDHLVRSCRGERREECPIIAEIGHGVMHGSAHD